MFAFMLQGKHCIYYVSMLTMFAFMLQGKQCFLFMLQGKQSKQCLY